MAWPHEKENTLELLAEGAPPSGGTRYTHRVKKTQGR